jgi:CheY-like chemotaxis protein
MSSNEHSFQSNQTKQITEPCTNASLAESAIFHDQSTLKGIHVLLVEDELDIAELLIVMLEGVGAHIMWAALAEEALDALEHFQPDILICNVKLPDRNGDWLIQQIRAKELGLPHHLPAIAVTSYSRDFTAKPLLLAGFDCFLSKLQDPHELISTVARLLQQSSNCFY